MGAVLDDHEIGNLDLHAMPLLDVGEEHLIAVGVEPDVHRDHGLPSRAARTRCPVRPPESWPKIVLMACATSASETCLPLSPFGTFTGTWLSACSTSGS